MKIRLTRRRAILAAGVAIPLVGFGAVAVPSALAAVTAPILVNANGPAVTDSTGTWSADKAYSSGSWGYDTLYGSGSTAHAIAGTSSPALYQTYNLFSGWTGYKFDVANGTYTVTLKFMEDWANAAGQRTFDVRIEGTTVLTAFDIFKTCGGFTACDKTFTANVADGQLNVQFNMDGGANYATVSAIQVTGGSGGGSGGGGDTTPPSAPSGLTVTGTTSSSVSLAWTASTDNVGVTGYDVYRGSTKLGTVTGTTFTDTGLTASTTYSYTVKARDAAGNVSGASNSVSATTAASGGGGDTTPPTAPSGLTVTGTTASSVSLAWTASTDNVGVTSYNIYRAGTKVGSSTSTSFTDTGLTASTTYSYTVKAKDAAGNTSGASNSVSATTASSGGTGGGGSRIVGYFTDWGVYARNYQPKNIETSGSASKLNVINYAFGNVTNGQCAVGDTYADYDKFYDATSSVDGTSDTWDAGALRGAFHQLQELKKLHPGLKVVWSFGGWTWSGGFGQAAANASAFANSCYALIHDPRWDGLFDGIDIDWEYPNNCGLSCDTSGFGAFKTLMGALRSKFGSGALVTAAITADGTSGGKIDSADYAGAAQYVNWYNLMTYDYFGAWAPNGPTAPHSPLTSYSGIPIPGFYADAAVQKLKSKGVAGSKILLGIGFYGRGWTGVTQAAPGGSASGPAPGTYEQGIEDYHVLVNTCPANGTVAGTAYCFRNGQWWSYDTPSTIGGKMSYVKSQGLGGSMFWELSGDTSGGQLISAMRSGLG